MPHALLEGAGADVQLAWTDQRHIETQVCRSTASAAFATNADFYGSMKEIHLSVLRVL